MRNRPGDDGSTTDRAWLDSRGLGSARVRAIAFGGSIAAHLVAILMYTTVAAILQPDAFNLYISRAVAKAKLSRWEEGIVDCSRALELDPNNGRALSNRGWCYLQLQRHLYNAKAFGRY